ncbi:MAG: hypothetical protein KDE04_25990 [Anaerolineales bacterium]|nr:hypothetical protein [Anaerolineales bacterium]
MDSANDQLDIAALQQEVERARRYKRFLKEYFRYFYHKVVTPLTYVNAIAELLEVIAANHVLPPTAVEYIPKLTESVHRLNEALYSEMETLKLGLVEVDDPGGATVDELQEAITKYNEAPLPREETFAYPEHLNALNQVLLQLLHSWRRDPVQKSLQFDKEWEQKALNLTIQLSEARAIEDLAKLLIEPATLALENFGGKIEVQSADGQEVVLRLSLPPSMTVT